MIFVPDTNVLLRVEQVGHPDHKVAADAVSSVLSRAETICLLPQTIYEFWNVSTRPEDRNGLGRSPSEADQTVRQLQEIFEILHDSAAVYDEWLKLVSQHGVSGIQVHDARIASAVLVHGVSVLMTFNTTDFKRFGINAIHPSDI